MKEIIFTTFLFFLPLIVLSDEKSFFLNIHKDTSLETFLWKKRPIIIFSDSPEDVNFKLQIEMLEENSEAVKERDIIILTDTNPEEKSFLRKKLRPRGFTLILIGKDGQVKLRKPFPWKMREISSIIDKMPIRKQEINSKK